MRYIIALYLFSSPFLYIVKLYHFDGQQNIADPTELTVIWNQVDRIGVRELNIAAVNANDVVVSQVSNQPAGTSQVTIPGLSPGVPYTVTLTYNTIADPNTELMLSTEEFYSRK